MTEHQKHQSNSLLSVNRVLKKTSLNRLAWSLRISLQKKRKKKKREPFLSCSIMMKTRCNDVTTVLRRFFCCFFFMLDAVTYAVIVVFMSHSRMLLTNLENYPNRSSMSAPPLSMGALIKMVWLHETGSNYCIVLTPIVLTTTVHHNGTRLPNGIIAMAPGPQ